MITDYDFNDTNSPDAKQINNFLDKMHLEQMQKVKVLEIKSSLETIIIKELYLHLG